MSYYFLWVFFVRYRVGTAFRFLGAYANFPTPFSFKSFFILFRTNRNCDAIVIPLFSSMSSFNFQKGDNFTKLNPASANSLPILYKIKYICMFMCINCTCKSSDKYRMMKSVIEKIFHISSYVHII